MKLARVNGVVNKIRRKLTIPMTMGMDSDTHYNRDAKSSKELTYFNQPLHTSI